MQFALKVDIGEIGTIAHYKGRLFSPGVDFLLDIGGQDMKCLRIRTALLKVFSERPVRLDVDRF